MKPEFESTRSKGGEVVTQIPSSQHCTRQKKQPDGQHQHSCKAICAYEQSNRSFRKKNVWRARTEPDTWNSEPMLPPLSNRLTKSPFLEVFWHSRSVSWTKILFSIQIILTVNPDEPTPCLMREHLLRCFGGRRSRLVSRGIGGNGRGVQSRGSFRELVVEGDRRGCDEREVGRRSVQGVDADF